MQSWYKMSLEKVKLLKLLDMKVLYVQWILHLISYCTVKWVSLLLHVCYTLAYNTTMKFNYIYNNSLSTLNSIDVCHCKSLKTDHHQIESVILDLFKMISQKNPKSCFLVVYINHTCECLAHTSQHH